jgi:hypothetical protein
METLATKLAGVVTVLPGAGEKTPLNRTPTKEEAAQGITAEQVARGRYAPATAGLKSELPDISMDKLSEAWKTFVSSAVFNLTAETDKKATKKKEPLQDEKGKVKPLSPIPAPAAAGALPPIPAAATSAPAAAGALPPIPAAAIRAPAAAGALPPIPSPSSRGAGPAYQTPVVLGDSRPENQTSTKSAAAGSATELTTVFSDGIKMLSRGQSDQTASIDELVELMRKSVGVQGKILQTSKA